MSATVVGIIGDGADRRFDRPAGSRARIRDHRVTIQALRRWTPPEPRTWSTNTSRAGNCSRRAPAVVVIAAPVDGAIGEIAALRESPPIRASLILDVASVKAPIVNAARGLANFVRDPSDGGCGDERRGCGTRRFVRRQKSWLYVPPGNALLESKGARSSNRWVRRRSRSTLRSTIRSSRSPRISRKPSRSHLRAACANWGRRPEPLCGPVARELLRLGNSESPTLGGNPKSKRSPRFRGASFAVRRTYGLAAGRAPAGPAYRRPDAPSARRHACGATRAGAKVSRGNASRCGAFRCQRDRVRRARRVMRRPCDCARQRCGYARRPYDCARRPCDCARRPCDYARRPCGYARRPCGCGRRRRGCARSWCSAARAVVGVVHRIRSGGRHTERRPRRDCSRSRRRSRRRHRVGYARVRVRRVSVEVPEAKPKPIEPSPTDTPKPVLA